MALFDCTNINLKKDSEGEQVKTLQTALKTLGYYTKTVDGEFGYYTQQAVKKFQSVYKLASDGVFGPISCKKMNEVMASKEGTKEDKKNDNKDISLDCTNIDLHKNSKGEQVTKLQTMLKALGYYTRQVDGDFGDYTEQAVKDFQKATGHTTDGRFGPKTCPDLNKAYKGKVQSTVETYDARPEYEKVETYSLTILPEVVVLPDTEISDEGKTSTGGSISTDTNFDCSKIDLHKGSSGDDVKKLQTILKARGYYTRQVDGVYGDYTVAAVKKLQTAQGNSPDGQFGPKTCNKLQGVTSSGDKKKSKKFTVTNFRSVPTETVDIAGFSCEVTVSIPYTNELFNRIRRLQKIEYLHKKGEDVILKHSGYINQIKVSNEDDNNYIELTLVGYTAFLEQTIVISEDVTGLKSELLKKFVEENGLKLNLDLTGLEDGEYTIKAQTTTTAATGGDGSAGLTQLSGNDCTDTFSISARSFDIDTCKGGTKIGNSSANYATDTAGMTAKEAILDIYNRFRYKGYWNNRTCPRSVWNKSGTIRANCADISRLVKCVGEVHGLKVGIRHCPNHYYNLIEVGGKTYKFDCCFKSGVTGSNYGSEVCNTLTKRGGPWS